jgi:SpoVK/Ycf46/Vps4 family AAA+-type ATPase
MLTLGLFSWKMTPSEGDLTGFLRVKKQTLFRRPVTTQLEPETAGTDSTRSKSPSQASNSSGFASFSSNTETVKTKAVFGEKLTSQKVFHENTINYPTNLEQGFNVEPEAPNRRLQYDFLVEGLLVEWRTRRKKFLAADPEDKAPGQSLFPHQHDQMKYWVWPFLGVVALTSSLPLVRSVKKPQNSTTQQFQIEMEAENNDLSTSQVFDTLPYNPHELTAQSNELFEQTLSLGLSPSDLFVSPKVAFEKESTSVLQHPMANFDYSKMILDALIKKTHCGSFKFKPGYVSNIVFTTSESESYLPIDPVEDNDVHDFSSSLNVVKLKDVVYSRSFVLPFITAKENWGHPVNPFLYRQWEKGLVYRYLNLRLSTEADQMRYYRSSEQFASRPVDESLRLEASFKELSLLKQFATPNQTAKVENKWKSKGKVKPWTTAMDSSQWLKNRVLNADNVSTNLLSNTQQESKKKAPTTVTLFAQDWPTFPNQMNRISKGNYTETDRVSFLNPLVDPQQVMATVRDLAKATEIPQMLQENIRQCIPAGVTGLLHERLSNLLVNWSFMYSTTEGILNDATFTSQLSKQTGGAHSQRFKWNRPYTLQNPNVQALAGTDSVNAADFPQALYEAYLRYPHSPNSLPKMSSDFTHTLERTQGPLTFEYEVPSGKKERNFFKKKSPTQGSVLKTFVFRSPSYLEDPYFRSKAQFLKRRRALRYKRVSSARKKRKRYFPRQKWLRAQLTHPLFKRRHPSVSTQSNSSRVITRGTGQIRSALNFKNKLTSNYLRESPSLFRQKGLYHNVVLPRLMDRNLFHLAKWAEPKSRVRIWFISLPSEFTPLTNMFNRNFQTLKQNLFSERFGPQVSHLPQWVWKGSRSQVEIERLRFKQLPFANNVGAFTHFNSDVMTPHLLLNELRSVAFQNTAMYKNLNTTISMQPDPQVLMETKVAGFTTEGRTRQLSWKNWAWPEAWSDVALTPFHLLNSQWVLKQSHLLRDKDSVTDIQKLWRTGKLRYLNTPVRESTQKSVFKLRLSFRSRTKVQPVTVKRAWKKLNVMDTKLKVFGLINHHIDLYPRQLKYRFQNDRGASYKQNTLLTPDEMEMQKVMNASVDLWWDETQSQVMIPLSTPLGTHPWNSFEALMARPQLTSESQSLTINLVNGSLILLHIALVSFLIQLPEARTLFKFYALIVLRVAKGYVWMTSMCYSLMLDCVYEIQFALFAGRVLLFTEPKFELQPINYNYEALVKLFYRVENNPQPAGFKTYREQGVPLALTMLGEKTESEDFRILNAIKYCLERYNELNDEETHDTQVYQKVVEKLRQNERKLNHHEDNHHEDLCSFPPRKPDDYLTPEQVTNTLTEVAAWDRDSLEKQRYGVLTEYVERNRLVVLKLSIDYLQYAEFLQGQRVGQAYAQKTVMTNARYRDKMGQHDQDSWWTYTDTGTLHGLEFSTDELTKRLEAAEENWFFWAYDVLYMKERQNAYKSKSLPVNSFYQHTLNQGLVIRELFDYKMAWVSAKVTRFVLGLSVFLSENYSRFYNAVDRAWLTSRRLTAKFLEEPAENTIYAINLYFFYHFMSDILSTRVDDLEAWNTATVEGYTRQLNALGPLGGLAQRRLHRLFDDFYIAFTRPDMDLLLRQQKSLIFWEMWGALLIRAIARYELSLADFLSTKEEQEKLLECLITEDDWSWTQQSLIQFQPLFDLLSVGDRNWNTFAMSTASKYLGELPVLEKVIGSTPDPLPPKDLQKLEVFENRNPADLLYTNNHAISIDDLSQRWGAQQTKIYASRLSTMGVEYHPAWGLQCLPQVKHYWSIHTQLGWIIKDNLLTTFTQTPSKNALIVGPPGPEVTSMIRALVGELELKFMVDTARRYTTVIRNVAIGARHLKEVIYTVSVEAPCLFVLEDIHLIGQRRQLLIAEDEQLHLLEKDQVTNLDEPYEQDNVINLFEKHTLLHYEKPFRGDYSFLISSNCFAYDYFSEAPPSRLRRVGRFTDSHYDLLAIEHELIKRRGLENLSNAQATEPSLSLTSTAQARPPTKEVKAAPNSPLTVAIEKNKKAFRPRRIVKNMPLGGISWDMWMLLSRYDYSIRSKVALLAVLTEDALGEITDTITDLLVMLDTVRGTRGLIMFATTHDPTSLDPALRRPGRLDETLRIPRYSSLVTRWQLLKQRLKASDKLQELAPYGHVTRNLANYEVLEFALKTTRSLLPRKISLKNRTKIPAMTPMGALKAKTHVSYFSAFLQSKGFHALKNQLPESIDITSESQSLDTQMRQRKFQNQVNMLTYTLVGAHVIRWKAKCITDETETDLLAYSTEKLHPLLFKLEVQKQKSDFMEARMADPVKMREHFTNSLASRFAETFFTSALVNAGPAANLEHLTKEMGSFQFTFQLREKGNYVPLTFENFELAATQFKPSGVSATPTLVPSFRSNIMNVGVPASRMSHFMTCIVQKRWVWSKNTVVHRLFYAPMKQAYREELAFPFYDLNDRDKNFETLQKEQRVLYTPGNLTMNEKIELHKTYRLYLEVANRTVEDWYASYNSEELSLLKRHVLPSLEDLSSLALMMNHPTGTNKYYRQSMHLRQRFSLIDEWWNGHLEEFDVYASVNKDIETRTFFVESYQNDAEIDYPQPEKYYHVRSRRWMSKQGSETWFAKEAKFNDTIAYHYMVCALTRCYGQLHKNRESLDQLAYSFLKEGALSELETFTHYTRFYHT